MPGGSCGSGWIRSLSGLHRSHLLFLLMSFFDLVQRCRRKRISRWPTHWLRHILLHLVRLRWLLRRMGLL